MHWSYGHDFPGSFFLTSNIINRGFAACNAKLHILCDWEINIMSLECIFLLILPLIQMAHYGFVMQELMVLTLGCLTFPTYLWSSSKFIEYLINFFFCFSQFCHALVVLSQICPGDSYWCKYQSDFPFVTLRSRS